MPLIKSKSKRAFEHNIKAEMEAGKPQKQALAISYSVKRKAPKRMADGGPVSAKSEKRPMPDQMSHDKQESMAKQKSLPQDKWTDSPTVRQAQASPKPKLQPIKGDRMVDSSVLKVSRIDHLGRRLDEIERHLEQHLPPAQPSEQPSHEMDKMGAKRQGPESHDLHMKRMAKGGKINDFEPMHAAEEDLVEHPAGLESDDDQMRPSMKRYMSGDMEMLAEGGEPMSLDEAQEQARQDQESARSEHEDEREKSMPARTPMKGKIIHEDDLMMAEGGRIDLDEQEDEKHTSIAAAIMAKKRREMQSSDSDEDRMVMMAEGGQVDLSRNADEAPNEEDQMSFEALKKENYSESAGLDQLDSPMDSSEHGDEREHDAENKHDMVSAIRRKMASRRQFSKP